MKFYSENHTLPDIYETEEFIFRPLTIEDVDMDYEAVMESKSSLRLISDSSWPSDDFSIQGNFDDLDKHERDHIARREFTFTIMNPDETMCLGCLYFRPLPSNLSTGELETSVRFWIRESKIVDNLDIRVFNNILKWIRQEWNFRRIIFVTGINETRQAKLFSQTGLKLIYKDEDMSQSRFQYFELLDK